MDQRNWLQMPGGGFSWVSVGKGGEVWAVTQANSIWRWNGICWDLIDGGLCLISVGDKDNIWGLNSNGQIWRRANGTWVLVDGGLTDISVGDNSCIWGVNAGYQTWFWDGNVGQFKPGDANLALLSVGDWGNIWGLSGGGQVWHRDTQGYWHMVDGTLSCIAVGTNGEVWGTSADNTIFRRDNATGNWIVVPGGLRQIDVYDSDNIWGVSSAGQVYCWGELIDYSNWMKKVSAAHPDKTLLNFVLPGTHDSGAYMFTSYTVEPNEPSWIKIVQQTLDSHYVLGPLGPFIARKIFNDVVSGLGQAQSLSIRQQLDFGVRFLDLRVVSTNGGLYVAHGFVGPDIGTVLNDVAGFLNATTGEIVILQFSHMDSLSASDHSTLQGLITSTLGSHLLPNVKSATLGKKVSELTNGSSRAIVIYDNAARSPSFSAPRDVFGYFADPFGVDGTTSYGRLKAGLDGAVTAYNDSSMLMNVGWTLTPDTGMSVTAVMDKLSPLPTPGAVTLHQLSKAANVHLPEFVAPHWQANHHLPNVITVDFVEETDIARIAYFLSSR